MAVGVVQNLDPSGPSDIPANMNTSLDGINDAIGGISKALKSVTEQAEQRNLAKVVEGMSDIELQVARNTQRQIELNDALSEAQRAGADASVLNDITNQIRRIKLGQEQGVLSVAKANIEIESRSRDFIKQYPSLATEIAKIKGTLHENVRKLDFEPDKDPFTKARNERTEYLQKTYGDLRTGTIVEASKERADAAKRTLDNALVVGKLSEHNVTAAIRESSSNVVAHVMGLMQRDIANGVADQTTLVQYLAQAKEAVLRGSQNTRLQYMQIDETGQAAAIFTDETIKAGYEPTIQALDDLARAIPYFNSLDQMKSYLDLQLKEIEKGNFDLFVAELGPVVGRAAAKDPKFAVDVLGGAMSRIEKWVREGKGNRAAFEMTGWERYIMGTDPTGRPRVPALYQAYGDTIKYLMGEADSLPTGLNSPEGKRAVSQEFATMFKQGNLKRKDNPEMFDRIVLGLHGPDIFRNNYVLGQIEPSPFDSPQDRVSKEQLLKTLGLKLGSEFKSRFENMTGDELALMEVGPNGITVPAGTASRIPAAAGFGAAAQASSYSRIVAAKYKDINDTFKLYVRLYGPEQAFTEVNKYKDMALGIEPTDLGNRNDGPPAN